MFLEIFELNRYHGLLSSFELCIIYFTFVINNLLLIVF